MERAGRRFCGRWRTGRIGHRDDYAGPSVVWRGRVCALGCPARYSPAPVQTAMPPNPNPTNWPTAPVSVVILTYNEEVSLPGALESCRWCDDVHVLDSGSSDRTVEIARQANTPVHHHTFESFGRQRNWAIDHIPTIHDWVFHLDADERFTPSLVGEMAHRLSAKPDVDGFLAPNKLILGGKWLKRSGGYPIYQTRLFHQERLRFSDHGHGQREAEGSRLEKLQEPYLHFAYSKGLDDWLVKHVRYSSQEAAEVLRGAGADFQLSELLTRDTLRRRRALKALAYRLPARPTLRWAWTLFVQGGILEGRAGRTYADMLRTYDRLIQLKLDAARRDVFSVSCSKPQTGETVKEDS